MCQGLLVIDRCRPQDACIGCLWWRRCTMRVSAQRRRPQEMRSWVYITRRNWIWLPKVSFGSGSYNPEKNAPSGLVVEFVGQAIKFSKSYVVMM